MLWCPVCGHGGHQACVQKWFARNETCPTGCGHSCRLETPVRTHRDGEIVPVSTEFCGVINTNAGDKLVNQSDVARVHGAGLGTGLSDGVDEEVAARRRKASRVGLKRMNALMT
jgi:hypothetical protein